MAIYSIWSLDVWGNEEEGFEVNDRGCINRSVEIDDDATDSDIIELMIDMGYLMAGSRDKGQIDGDSEYTMWIEDMDTLEPWIQLQRESKVEA